MSPAPRSLFLPLLALAGGLALFVFLAARWLMQDVAEPAAAPHASAASTAKSPGLEASVRAPAGGAPSTPTTPTSRWVAPSAPAGLDAPAAAPRTSATAGAGWAEGVRVGVPAIYSGPAVLANETELARQNRIWAQGLETGRRMKGERVNREEMAADLHEGDWVAQVIFVAGFEWGSL